MEPRSIGTYAHNTIINDSIKNDIEYFKDKNIKIINSSPLAMGLLTDKGPPDWHPASEKMLNTVKDLKIYLVQNIQLQMIL